MALHNYIYYRHDDSTADKIARPHDTRPQILHSSSHDSLSDIHLDFNYDDLHNLKIDVDEEKDVDRRLDELSLRNIESNQSSLMFENDHNELEGDNNIYSEELSNPLMMSYLSNLHMSMNNQYNKESYEIQNHHESGNSNSTTNTLISANPSGSSTDEFQNSQTHDTSFHLTHKRTQKHSHSHNHIQIAQNNKDTNNEIYDKCKNDYQYNFDEYQTSNFVKSVVVPPITASLPMSVRMTRNSSSKSSVRNSFEGYNDPKSKNSDQSNPQVKKKRKLRSRFSRSVLEKRQGKGVKDVRNNQI